jgi:hypothetical protein
MVNSCGWAQDRELLINGPLLDYLAGAKS